MTLTAKLVFGVPQKLATLATFQLTPASVLQAAATADHPVAVVDSF